MGLLQKLICHKFISKSIAMHPNTYKIYTILHKYPSSLKFIIPKNWFYCIPNSLSPDYGNAFSVKVKYCTYFKLLLSYLSDYSMHKSSIWIFYETSVSFYPSIQQNMFRNFRYFFQSSFSTFINFHVLCEFFCVPQKCQIMCIKMINMFHNNLNVCICGRYMEL